MDNTLIPQDNAPKAEENATQSKFDKTMKSIFEWIEIFVFSAAFVLLLFTFVARVVTVDGNSMNKTLLNKERIIVSNLFYTPQNEDIVVFQCEGAGNALYVKRVIGVAGDKIRIDFTNRKIYRNGVELVEDYIWLDPDYDGRPLTNGSFPHNTEVTVPQGTVFVLGDNRFHSADSRYSSVGFVKVETIVGKAIFRVFPFNKIGTID